MRASRVIAAALLAASVQCGSMIGQTPAPTPAPPQNPALSDQIAALLADPAVAHAHWGIAVTTLDGAPVYSLDEAKLFRPASSAKLFTTAAAMALLGPDSHVTTTVTTFGTIDASGVLHGDVVLHGAGDANLSGRTLPYQHAAGAGSAAEPRKKPSGALDADALSAVDEFATQIAARGIKEIDGTVIGDDTLWPWEPYPPGWAIEDEMWGYGAPVSALAVNDNSYEVLISAGSVRDQQATISVRPELGMIHVVNDVYTGPSFANPFQTIQVGDGEVDVSGSIGLGQSQSEHLAVTSPASFAAKALLARLQAHGIAATRFAGSENLYTSDLVEHPTTVIAMTTSGAKGVTNFSQSWVGGPLSCAALCLTLAKRDSASLTDDITVTMKFSLNLHAEMMLKRMADQAKSMPPNLPSFGKGVVVVRGWLEHAGIDPGDFVFYDGSGLSTKDLVTPRATVKLLVYAATQPWFLPWRAALPVGGVDGTLAERFKQAPLKGHVFAKTGTLGESRALSGYVDCASGKQVAFSILVDNHTPGSTADRVVMDKIVAAIAAAN